MKAICVGGNRVEIYGDSLEVYDELPVKAYTIRFSKMTGFYLELRNAFEIKEEKIYGIHEEKVKKVMRTYENAERNLGVILSGDKGIGKSLFAKLLANTALEQKYPIVVVDQYMPGIAAYIESIEQEVVVLFDEFDKTFGINRDGNPQDELLSLFDGMSNGKKLFVVTCNDVYKLSEFLINRPGRFHYHFRFDYPDASEVRTYLKDKLLPEFHDEIQKVVAFSRKVNLNYDCLRAIAFELSLGIEFSHAIQDLNIIRANENKYKITLHYDDGTKMYRTGCRFDLFDPESFESYWLGDAKDTYVCVEFSMKNAKYNQLTNEYQVDAEAFLDVCFDSNKENRKIVERLKALSPKYLSITLERDKNIHYTV